ncbi:MAG: Ca2+-dependent phosphoinositide-specific phospholipase C, partial [Candidatus Thalassarchaeaceae archaeon]
MKTVTLALCCLMLSTPLAGCIDFLGSSDGVFDEQEPLRINHIQVLGTHNSYHIEPFGPTIRAYDYTHEALDVQAEYFGVRQFELDVWWDPRGQLYVYHNQYDFRSNCATFEDCLNTLLTWSDNNPNHVPLMIWVEPKEWVRSSTDETVVLELQDMLEKIETEIGQWWPR